MIAVAVLAEPDRVHAGGISGHDPMMSGHERVEVVERVDAAHFEAAGFEPVNELGEMHAHLDVGALQVRPARHTDDRRIRRDAASPIGDQGSRCTLHIGDVRGEWADVVERWRERDHAGTGDAIVAGLEPDHTAERCRAHDRADRLSAQRDLGQAGRNGRRRPAGRPARCMRGVVRVARGAGAEIRELGGHGLAHDERSGVLELSHGGSLRARQGLRRQMTAGSSLEAVDAEDVLHADQRAEQGRPCRAIGPTLLERGRVAAQPIEPIRFGHVSEHVGFACRESAFEFVDPVVQSRKRTLAEQCHFLSFAGAQS